MNYVTGGNGMISSLGQRLPWPAASDGGPQPDAAGTIQGRGFHRSGQSATAVVAWLAALASHLGTWFGRAGA